MREIWSPETKRFKTDVLESFSKPRVFWRITNEMRPKWGKFKVIKAEGCEMMLRISFRKKEPRGKWWRNPKDKEKRSNLRQKSFNLIRWFRRILNFIRWFTREAKWSLRSKETLSLEKRKRKTWHKNKTMLLLNISILKDLKESSKRSRRSYSRGLKWRTKILILLRSKWRIINSKETS